MFFTPMTAATDSASMFLGPPSAHLSIPLRVNDSDPQPTRQSSGSLPGSQASSAPSVAGESRIRRRDLSSSDKVNIDCACDLVILEIVENIGWNSGTEQLAVTVQECLSQACADSTYSLLSFSSCAGADL